MPPARPAGNPAPEWHRLHESSPAAASRVFEFKSVAVSKGFTLWRNFGSPGPSGACAKLARLVSILRMAARQPDIPGAPPPRARAAAWASARATARRELEPDDEDKTRDNRVQDIPPSRAALEAAHSSPTRIRAKGVAVSQEQHVPTSGYIVPNETPAPAIIERPQLWGSRTRSTSVPLSAATAGGAPRLIVGATDASVTVDIVAAAFEKAESCRIDAQDLPISIFDAKDGRQKTTRASITAVRVPSSKLSHKGNSLPVWGSSKTIEAARSIVRHLLYDHAIPVSVGEGSARVWVVGVARGYEFGANISIPPQDVKYGRISSGDVVDTAPTGPLYMYTAVCVQHGRHSISQLCVDGQVPRWVYAKAARHERGRRVPPHGGDPLKTRSSRGKVRPPRSSLARELRICIQRLAMNPGPTALHKDESAPRRTTTGHAMYVGPESEGVGAKTSPSGTHGIQNKSGISIDNSILDANDANDPVFWMTGGVTTARMSLFSILTSLFAQHRVRSLQGLWGPPRPSVAMASAYPLSSDMYSASESVHACYTTAPASSIHMPAAPSLGPKSSSIERVRDSTQSVSSAHPPLGPLIINLRDAIQRTGAYWGDFKSQNAWDKLESSRRSNSYLFRNVSAKYKSWAALSDSKCVYFLLCLRRAARSTEKARYREWNVPLSQHKDTGQCFHGSLTGEKAPCDSPFHSIESLVRTVFQGKPAVPIICEPPKPSGSGHYASPVRAAAAKSGPWLCIKCQARNRATDARCVLCNAPHHLTTTVGGSRVQGGAAAAMYA